jgi:hypothetical protein
VAVAELQARTADVEAAARKRAAAAKQYKEVRSLRYLPIMAHTAVVVGDVRRPACCGIGTSFPRPRMMYARLTCRVHPFVIILGSTTPDCGSGGLEAATGGRARGIAAAATATATAIAGGGGTGEAAPRAGISHPQVRHGGSRATGRCCRGGGGGHKAPACRGGQGAVGAGGHLEADGASVIWSGNGSAARPGTEPGLRGVTRLAIRHGAHFENAATIPFPATCLRANEHATPA